MSKYYLAYGTNLNKQEMKIRSPDAVFLGTSILNDHKLIFRGTSTFAFASIESRIGESVQVAIWKISEQDEKSLDIYEGIPTLYYKKNLTMQFNDEEIELLFYIMNDEYQIGYPTKNYLKRMEEGYKDCGFDLKPLLKVLKEMEHYQGVVSLHHVGKYK